MLRARKLVQVQGTLGTGKSTLMCLLHDFICESDPEATVYLISTPWKSPQKPLPTLEGQLQQVAPRYTQYRQQRDNTYLLFDNAQATYWDTQLWISFFKDIPQGPYDHVALFCQYDGPYPQMIDHLMPIPEEARLPFRPYASNVKPHVGLLLSRSEFDDFVRLHSDPIRSLLDVHLREMLYVWTTGHVAVVKDLLRYIGSERQSQFERGEVLTFDDFLDNFSLDDIFKRIEGQTYFAQRLSRNTQLSEAPIFRKLLRMGLMEVEEDDVSEDARMLMTCYHNGWIYPDYIYPDPTQTIDRIYTLRYTFPSPLHASYYSWKLLPSNADVPFDTLFDLVLAAVGQLKVSRPPKAQYQDAFRQALLLVTDGCLLAGSQFASALRAVHLGHIDFLIPAKGWEIEIAGERDRLEGYCSGFGATGVHRPWLGYEITDYVLLDFRTEMPTMAHPGTNAQTLLRLPQLKQSTDITNLFHIISEGDSGVPKIYNNELEMVRAAVEPTEG
ncbi:hypothetical protein BOTBODRAFT_181260 [Botryobasidium botryosum FD-172 SS1]|uniref:NB-ARC domain-containing protein n=1 Tax=Botryobasidium botryosum (strain FD-172 SS1) TaxID=930990 RepID=A0A067LWW1_BOTB1|nr:hypothetical protein BOTBODRAFT_181260 [Botryobasidium botryosum FD-172 SS1]